MSRWSLDSDDYDAHVNLWNQLHSQHPKLLPLAWLGTMQSQPALNKSYAIGDEVLFEGSPELYIFLGEKHIHQHKNRGQDEYMAEFRALREPSYHPWPIHLILHHHIQWDCLIPPPRFLSWDWFKAKLWRYCHLWLTVVMRWSISEVQMTCFRADED